MLFWIIAAVLGAGVAATLWRASVVGARTALGGSGKAEVGIYRDQLAGVERDLARGVIAAEDAQRLRIEISRRILAADRRRQGEDAAQGAGPRLVAPLLAFAGVAVGGALYLWLGAPGYPDVPLSARLAAAEAARAARPSQAAAEAVAPSQAVTPEAEFATLMEALRASTVANPDKIEGFRLLVTNEAQLGNFAAAARAKARVIALSQAEAVTADDYAELGDLLVRAAGGVVTESADAAIAAALQLDPDNGTAQFYAGLMEAQIGRPDRAFAIWRKLLESGPQDAPWVDFVRANLGALGQAAGVDYVAPAALPGPDAEDVAAAAEMSAEDRAAMIRGMVAGLEDRLAAEGGPADEWARLIGSLGVLGETERARAAYAQARAAHADHPESLSLLEAAARSAGLVE